MTTSKLTQKQEAFAIAYVKRGNASEAYRDAYDAGKATAKTVNEMASRLLNDRKIAARIAEIRAPAIEAAQLTEERTLKELAAIAYAEGATVATSDKLRALDMAMKHQGLFEKDNAQQADSLTLRIVAATPVKR